MSDAAPNDYEACRSTRDVEQAYHFIMDGITWSKTQEGHQYWQDVRKRLGRIVNNSKLGPDVSKHFKASRIVPYRDAPDAAAAAPKKSVNYMDITRNMVGQK